MLTSMMILSQRCSASADDAAGGGQSQAAVLGDRRDFDDADIVATVLGVEAVAGVLGEVAEVLVTHADAAGVDPGSDVLAGLVGPAAVDHVEGRPAILGLSADRSADEQVELHLALQLVGLDMVGQGDGHHFRVAGRGEP